jgi:hypothetical protein
MTASTRRRHNPTGRPPVMSGAQFPGMTQPLMFCAICARQALQMAAAAGQAFAPGAIHPRIVHSEDDPPGVPRGDGAWPVRAARAIAGGESVCMFHLATPEAMPG